MICSLYGHLSVQYAETTDGVLPVQVGLSVHSLSCGRLCLPQVRIIFSSSSYLRGDPPNLRASCRSHHGCDLFKSDLRPFIFSHLKCLYGHCPYTTPKLMEYSPFGSGLRLRTPYYSRVEGRHLHTPKS